MVLASPNCSHLHHLYFLIILSSNHQNSQFSSSHHHWFHFPAQPRRTHHLVCPMKNLHFLYSKSLHFCSKTHPQHHLCFQNNSYSNHQILLPKISQFSSNHHHCFHFPAQPRRIHLVCPMKNLHFLSSKSLHFPAHPVSHLKGALERREIKTFIDYKLDGGEEIQSAIEGAIEKSNIAVVVVSQNFHSSPWCLNELVKILECHKKWGLIVLPIFWGIDARELREQSGLFVENIGVGEESFKQEKPHQVRRWRKALQALGMINGFPVSASLDRTDAEVIEALADKIAAKQHSV